MSPRGKGGARKRRSSRSGLRRSSKMMSREQLEDLYQKVAERVRGELGLSDDVVGDRVLRDVLEPIVFDIAGRVSRPNPESIAKRVILMRDQFLKGVAARLLEFGEELTREQLEFVLVYAPDLAGKAAPLLYDIAVRLGALDLVEGLRDLWEAYGRPTAARCPRCGFKALGPDLACLVCGASISEEELKRSIGFEDMLKRFAKSAPRRLVEEVLAVGYVYYEDGALKAPSEPQGPHAVRLVLGRREREKLRAMLTTGGGGGGAGGPRS